MKNTEKKMTFKDFIQQLPDAYFKYRFNTVPSDNLYNAVDKIDFSKHNFIESKQEADHVNIFLSELLAMYCLIGKELTERDKRYQTTNIYYFTSCDQDALDDRINRFHNLYSYYTNTNEIEMLKNGILAYPGDSKYCLVHKIKDNNAYVGERIFTVDHMYSKALDHVTVIAPGSTVIIDYNENTKKDFKKFMSKLTQDMILSPDIKIFVFCTTALKMLNLTKTKSLANNFDNVIKAIYYHYYVSLRLRESLDDPFNIISYRLPLIDPDYVFDDDCSKDMKYTECYIDDSGYEIDEDEDMEEELEQE